MAGKQVAVIVGGIALVCAGCSHGDVASSATRLAASATTSTSLPAATASTASTASTAPPDTAASATGAAVAAGAAGATPSTAATVPRPAVATTAPPTTAPPATTAVAPQEPPGSTAPPATDPPTTAAPPAAATITIQNFAFSPPVLDVAVGSTVTVTNLDGVTHTWTADGGAWDSGGLPRNASYTHTFTSPGTFTYHCAIHASMKGTVNVS